MSWNFSGVYYSLLIGIVICIILVGAKVFHVPDATWALISGVVCAELEVDLVRKVMLMRIFSTLVGVMIGAFVLIFLGANYFALILGVVITILVCQSIAQLRDGWRLATATSVVVLVAGLQLSSIHAAETVALKRAMEVMGGSLVAGIVSYCFSMMWPLKRGRSK